LFQTIRSLITNTESEKGVCWKGSRRTCPIGENAERRKKASPGVEKQSVQETRIAQVVGKFATIGEREEKLPLHF